MKNMIIIEKGILRRCKFSTATEEKDNISSSFRKESSISDEVLKDSVVVDELSGRGRVVGLLHNVQEGSASYATLYSHGPAKVWLVSGFSLRQIISSKPEFSLYMIQSLAQEIRVGTKSIRALVKAATSKGGGEGAKDKRNVCKVLCYDTTSWVKEGFTPAIQEFNKQKGEDDVSIVMDFTTERLGEKSATFAAGYDAVCLFVNDTANATVLKTLSLLGVKMVAMRCAGFDRVDTKAAKAYGLTVARVPAYSPYAVAEMGLALLMTLNRKVHRACNRVNDGNFTLDGGLMGMDIYGKTVGVMGTGKIGQILCNIIKGLGADLVCYDVFESEFVKSIGGVYVSKDEIYAKSDVIFLMMPLLPTTHHTINDDVLPKLKKGVLLINTARGGLVNTKSLVKGLRNGTIGGVGMDVYENEADYFFQDWSARTIQDEDLVTLMSMHNVVMTAHQAFFTKEAVNKIVQTTIENIRDFKEGKTGKSHPNSVIR